VAGLAAPSERADPEGPPRYDDEPPVPPPGGVDVLGGGVVVVVVVVVTGGFDVVVRVVVRVVVVRVGWVFGGRWVVRVVSSGSSVRVLVRRFEVVVEEVVVVDDGAEDALPVVVVVVVVGEVLLSVVTSSWTSTVSLLLRSGWASSPAPPASMATVAKAVDTTRPATPRARYGERRRPLPSAAGGASSIRSSGPRIPAPSYDSPRDRSVTAR
jgi:hypothetical protein